MATSSLVVHKGARFVERPELDTIEAPPPTNSWFPLKHSVVLDRVTSTLQQAGFELRSTRLALSRGNARFFGTLDLATPVADGVGLAVGIRNSTDKSLPIAFCAGSRVFVCDNLAFRSEIAVARKHTRFGEVRFTEAIAQAVQSLHQFQATEARRIRQFQDKELTDVWASHLLLRAYEEEVISHRQLPDVLQEWREPLYPEFRPRNLWSLFNAFTYVLRNRRQSNPQQFAALTIRLQDLLGTEAGLTAEPVLSTPA